MAESSSSSTDPPAGSEEAAEEFVSDNGVGALVCALAVGVICRAYLKHWIPLPYTVMILLIGICIGLIVVFSDNSLGNDLEESLDKVRFMNPEIIFFALLPILIFESAFFTDVHIFMRELWQVLALAGPGVVVASVLTGTFARYAFPYDWSWDTSLYFGAMMSATDPVAVVALLKELGVSERLSVLIEGESLMNDGTSIVVFSVFFDAATGVAKSDAPTIIKQFFRLALGGPAVGIMVGFCSAFFVGFILEDPLSEITTTVVACYGAFLISEGTPVKVSGVLALVVCGLYMSFYGRPRISGNVQERLHDFWSVLGYLANTIIFFITGLVVAQGSFGPENEIVPSDWGYLIALYLFVHVVRALVVLMCYPVLKRGYGTDWRQMMVLWYGGLRGAVGLTLALIVREDPAIDVVTGDRVLFLMAGLALMTLVINGSTTGHLIHVLGLDGASRAQTEVFIRACSAIEAKLEHVVDELRKDRFLGDSDWPIVWRYIPVLTGRVYWHRIRYGSIELANGEEQMAIDDDTPLRPNRLFHLPPRLRNRWASYYSTFHNQGVNSATLEEIGDVIEHNLAAEAGNEQYRGLDTTVHMPSNGGIRRQVSTPFTSENSGRHALDRPLSRMTLSEHGKPLAPLDRAKLIASGDSMGSSDEENSRLVAQLGSFALEDSDRHLGVVSPDRGRPPLLLRSKSTHARVALEKDTAVNLTHFSSVPGLPSGMTRSQSSAVMSTMEPNLLQLKATVQEARTKLSKVNADLAKAEAFAKTAVRSRGNQALRLEESPSLAEDTFSERGMDESRSRGTSGSAVRLSNKLVRSLTKSQAPPEVQALAAARTRFVNAVKANYVTNFRKGWLSDSGLRVLQDNADEQLDKPEEPVSEWSRLKSSFVIPDSQLNIANKLRDLPFLGSVVSGLIFKRLAFIFELASNFIAAHEDINIQELLPESPSADQLAHENITQLSEASATLGQQLPAFPEVARSLKTQVSARFLLYRHRQFVDELMHDGFINESEYETLMHENTVFRTMLDDHPYAEELPPRHILLRRVPFLRDLPDEEVERLVSDDSFCKDEFHGSNIVLLKQGGLRLNSGASKGEQGWYYIVRGSVQMTLSTQGEETEDQDQEQQRPQMLHAGAVFGMTDQMLDRPFRATYTSSSFVHLVVFHKQQLLEDSAENAVLARSMWRSVGVSLLRKFYGFHRMTLGEMQKLIFSSEFVDLMQEGVGVGVSRIGVKLAEIQAAASLKHAHEKGSMASLGADTDDGAIHVRKTGRDAHLEHTLTKMGIFDSDQLAVAQLPQQEQEVALPPSKRLKQVEVDSGYYILLVVGNLLARPAVDGIPAVGEHSAPCLLTSVSGQLVFSMTSKLFLIPLAAITRARSEFVTEKEKTILRKGAVQGLNDYAVHRARPAEVSVSNLSGRRQPSARNSLETRQALSQQHSTMARRARGNSDAAEYEAADRMNGLRAQDGGEGEGSGDEGLVDEPHKSFTAVRMGTGLKLVPVQHSQRDLQRETMTSIAENTRRLPAERNWVAEYNDSSLHSSSSSWRASSTNTSSMEVKAAESPPPAAPQPSSPTSKWRTHV
jgi:NhaP-type Na+/H+ or K+/H+ antiporter